MQHRRARGMRDMRKESCLCSCRVSPSCEKCVCCVLCVCVLAPTHFLCIWSATGHCGDSFLLLLLFLLATFYLLVSFLLSCAAAGRARHSTTHTSRETNMLVDRCNAHTYTHTCTHTYTHAHARTHTHTAVGHTLCTAPPVAHLSTGTYC